MWISVVAVLANVLGLISAALALLLFSRDNPGGRAWLLSRRGQGTSCILVAGCLLAIGGQYKLARILQEPAAHAKTRTELQATLQEPLDVITVVVAGADPFAGQSNSTVLRLSLITKAGLTFVSEVPQEQMRPVGASQEELQEHAITWRSVLEGVADEGARADAARIDRLADLRRIERVEAEVVVRAAECVPMPDSLRIIPNQHASLPIFWGSPAAKQALQQGETWVSAYHDEESPSDRMTTWEWRSTPPVGGLGLTWMGAVAVCLVLLAVGIGMLFREGNLNVQKGVSSNAVTYTAEPQPSPSSLPDLMQSARGAPVPRVWARPSVWLALQIVILFCIYGFADDFQMAPEGEEGGQRAYWISANVDGYLCNSLASEVSWDSFIRSLNSRRTFFFPLVLKAFRSVSPSFAGWPFCELGVHVMAVLLFYLGLRAVGISGWIATAVSSTLFYSNFVLNPDYRHFIMSDPLGESMAILTVGSILLLVGHPRSALAWAGLTLGLFLTYQTRPSYLFLVGLVPPLGLLLAGLLSPRSEGLRRCLRLGAGLVAASILPYLGWCSLRWVLVGHFGLVSYGGLALLQISGLWLTDDLVPELPEDVRPLARAVLQDSASLSNWRSPVDSAGHFDRRIVEDEDGFSNLAVERGSLFATNAQRLYGNKSDESLEPDFWDWPRLNPKLSKIALGLVKARPSSYASWLWTAFRIGVVRILATNYLPVYLGLLASLAALWHGLYVIRRLGFLRPVVRARPGPAGDYLLVLNVMVLIAVSFALSGFLQVIVVAPPEVRYLAPAGVFLPTVPMVALFHLWGRVRSLFPTAGPSSATLSTHTSMPSDAKLTAAPDGRPAAVRPR